MGTSIETIFNTYPGLKDDADKATYIECAKTQTSSCFYGSRYEQAVALRAAHNLILSKPDEYRSSLSGGVMAKKQRNLSVQYGQTNSNNVADKSGLSQTTYGTQLLALMRMSNSAMGSMGMSSLCGV
jgi:hypothetical protein